MVRLGRRSWHLKNGLGTTKCWRLLNRLTSSSLTELTTDCNRTRCGRRRLQKRAAMRQFSRLRLDHGSLLEVFPLDGTQPNARPSGAWAWKLSALLAPAIKECGLVGVCPPIARSPPIARTWQPRRAP